MSTSQHLSRFSYSCAIQNVGKQDFINIYDTHHFGFSLTQWNENWHTWNIDIDKYTCEIMSSKLWKIKKLLNCFCYEFVDYYLNCEIMFMSLANIHAIRKSFLALRSLCAMSPEQPGWVISWLILFNPELQTTHSNETGIGSKMWCFVWWETDVANLCNLI